MILYQLGNRTLCMSLEEVLALTDDEIQMFVAHEKGSIINNFMVESALIDLTKDIPDEIEEEIQDEYEDPDLFSQEDIEDFLTNDSFGDIE